MTTEHIALLVERRTTMGYREDESRTMLEELLRRHDGDNLEAALVYNGFATARQARNAAATK